MDDYSHFLGRINNCNPEDLLLSRTNLGKQLDKILLYHINPTDLITWTQALNLEQLISREDGLARDYRGLAQLMGFSAIELESFKKSHNPTKKLIDTFITRNENKTVNDLLKLIEALERFDVIDDFLPNLVQMANSKSAQENKMMLLSSANRIASQQQQHDTIALSTHAQQHRPQNGYSNGSVDTLSRLTIDDNLSTTNSKIIYDAFVCFAPEDYQYAQDLISFFEEHGKRVATADDLLPGQFEFDALAQLIDLRCRKVIIILTPNFSRSKECEFQTKYASEIAIKAGYPKIIPVLYEACDQTNLPPMIGVMSKIDMTTRSRMPNLNWPLNKLLRSLDFDINSVSQQNDRFLKGFNNVKPQQYSQASSIQIGPQSQPQHQAQQPALLAPQDGSQTMANPNGRWSPSLESIRDPIVELSYSQSSGSMMSSTSHLLKDNLRTTRRDSPTIQPPGASDLKSFIRHIGQRFHRTRNGQSIRSTTSQAPLLDISASKSGFIDSNENLGQSSGSNI